MWNVAEIGMEEGFPAILLPQVAALCPALSFWILFSCSTSILINHQSYMLEKRPDKQSTSSLARHPLGVSGAGFL